MGELIVVIEVLVFFVIPGINLVRLTKSVSRYRKDGEKAPMTVGSLLTRENYTPEAEEAFGRLQAAFIVTLLGLPVGMILIAWTLARIGA